MSKSALVVVDMQRDFCEGGALAAANTPSLLQPLKNYIDEARRHGVLIVYTQDWHPANHSSFKVNGGPWPVHCVANTPGAELMPPLVAQAGDVVIHKGVGVDGAAYSGFDEATLEQQLREKGIDRVGVAGVATEYCVRATALDALKAKFETTMLEDLVRAVQDKDVPTAVADLKQAGGKLATSAAWLAATK
ncbi:MAG TPA: isochorismatase family protein [Candidatus Acidoferrum sp.]|nr:isochorismatase family protein [Candidatus Acidoferrum sp.]